MSLEAVLVMVRKRESCHMRPFSAASRIFAVRIAYDDTRKHCQLPKDYLDENQKPKSGRKML